MPVKDLKELRDLGPVNKTFNGKRDSLPVSAWESKAKHGDTAADPNQICGRLWNIKTCFRMLLALSLSLVAVAATLGTLLGVKLTSNNGAGEWNSVPFCESKRCAALPSLLDATIVYGNNSSDVGDTIELICNEGFDMIGNGTMVCLPNGTWSTMPRCEPNDCGSPPCGLPVVPNHVGITHIHGTNYQDFVEVNCHEGFTLQGDNMMRCSNQSLWTPIPNCTIKDCGNPPPLMNAAINNLTTTYFNSTFVVQCNEGYTASSNNYVVCDSNGQWTNLPTCNPVVCRTLVPPENGHITFINGTAFGDVATISCNDGYTLNGSQFVTCLSSGEWSDFPSCQIVNIDDCNPSPCHNGGVCADGVNTYTCSCADGFAGTECETNINECSSNPCQNNGSCNDGVNNYTCCCLSGFTGTNCETGSISTKILSVDNGGKWGEWGYPEFCPPGTYASGYIMKMAPRMNTADDTFLNAIRLICSDLVGTATGNITSLEGPFGVWLQWEHCAPGTYLVDFRLQVEEFPPEKSATDDNTCANYVKFHCRDLAGSNNAVELVLPPGYGAWGSWGIWSETCGPKSAICGISTRVEDYQGEGNLASNDDTSLNDVHFYCCDNI